MQVLQVPKFLRPYDVLHIIHPCSSIQYAFWSNGALSSCLQLTFTWHYARSCHYILRVMGLWLVVLSSTISSSRSCRQGKVSLTSKLERTNSGLELVTAETDEYRSRNDLCDSASDEVLCCCLQLLHCTQFIQHCFYLEC